MLVGAWSGAIAGLVVGGVGGRLAMLLLRLTSPDFVVGVTSDDGFEIGVVSTRTFDPLLATAGLGAINGVLYSALREAIPGRLRLLLWTLLAASLGGASVVPEDGIDSTLLRPASLAVALFVALPAAAAAVVVLLVERWSRMEPWADRRLAVGICASALARGIALVFAGIVGAASLVVRRVGAADLLRRAGRVAVPVGLSSWSSRSRAGRS